MKRMLVIMALTLPACIPLNAQKFCYVNTEYILENIPEYKSAMQQLDQISIQWQKEIEAKYAHIDKLYKDYQAEQILLTEEMRKKREQEIVNREKEAKELQKQRFGFEGDLFKKKQELIKPIQDKIYNAIKKMATEQGYAIVFDKSSDLIMLYASSRYDKSDEILLQLGYKAGTKSETKATGETPRETPRQPAESRPGIDRK
jgi:outer membrane protein